MINDKKLVYLAGPFADVMHDPKLAKKRVKLFDKVAAILKHQKGYEVFSPLSHGYPIQEVINKKFNDVDKPGDWIKSNDWMPFDLFFLEKCDELFILAIEGWASSRGVLKEIACAKLNNIPIKMVSPRGKITKYKEINAL